MKNRATAMAIRTDYHIHTTISVDAEARLSDAVERAIELGLTEIAITDHVDHNPADEGAGLYDPAGAYEATRAAAVRYGDRIAVRAGAELDCPHLYADRNAEIYALPPDVVIGAVHYVDEYGVHDDLFDAVDRSEAIGRYFRIMLDMVRDGDMDVLGHLDYFERYTFQRRQPAYDPDDYGDLIAPILETIISRGIALEVNSSGLRKGRGFVFPRPEVLAMYRRMGGRLLSVGSDAHAAGDVGAGLAECADLLADCGFKEYHVYRARRAFGVPITGSPGG